MAPPDVLQWVIWGLVGSPFMFRGILWALSIFRFVWGRLGVSSHLQVCWVSLGAPSIFRHVERTWGGLLAPPDVLQVPEGSCPLPHLSRMGTLSKLDAWTLPPLEFEALTGGLGAGLRPHSYPLLFWGCTGTWEILYLVLELII